MFEAFLQTAQTIFEVARKEGRLVRNLFSGEAPKVYAGEFKLTWDGQDDGAHPVPSGVYLTRIETESGVRTGRIVVTR